MKRILCLVLGLLAAQCSASMIPLLAGSPPSPILFQDTLTYADAAAAASAGWTNTGTVSWGSTSGPGSMSGSASLGVGGAGNTTTSPAFTHGGGTVYVYLKEWGVSTNANEQNYLNFRTPDDATSLFTVVIRSSASNSLRVSDSGGSNTSGNNAYATATVYPLKVRYTPGTGSGSNAVLTLWTSTDGVNWTQQANLTTGNATGLMGRIRFSSATSSSTFARYLYVSTADYTPAQLAALP